MRTYLAAAVCALTMILACCLVPGRIKPPMGTWILYAGGSMTCDVLHFDDDGTGEGFRLDRECEEVWLQGLPVPDEALTEERAFQWRLTGEDAERLELAFADGGKQTFTVEYLENLEGTGLPGLSLTNDIGGGGWIRASLQEP